VRSWPGWKRSQVVALRGPGGLALDPPAALLGLASERRASCRGLAVAWLKRGVGVTKVLELGVPATVQAAKGTDGTP